MAKKMPDDLKALVKRVNKARDFPTNTTPASRHVQMIGEALAKGQQYPMLSEEPQHCAWSLLSTVAGLYEARTAIAALEARVRELEAGICHRDADSVVVPRALWEEMDRVGLEWKARAEQAEAALSVELPDPEETLGGLASVPDEATRKTVLAWVHTYRDTVHFQRGLPSPFDALYANPENERILAHGGAGEGENG